MPRMCRRSSVNLAPRCSQTASARSSRLSVRREKSPVIGALYTNVGRLRSLRYSVTSRLMLKKSILPCLLVLAGLLAGRAVAQPIGIVAAENFYGDVAEQLTGSNATVSSVLSKPDQDPHLFEASPSVARLLAGASIVVYNGVDYDPWMTKLLSVSRSPNRTVIVVADLVHRKPGDNPHFWYDPSTMPAYAKALSATLSQRDPAHQADYDQRLRAFLDALQPMQVKITEL